jgi:DNA (cytosine-5)-methyltransferase 1
MQEDIVPVEDVHDAVGRRDGPFLVSGPVCRPEEDAPDSTALCVPMIMGQHSNAAAKDATTDPVPTIAKRGAIHQFTPESFVLPRNGARGDQYSNETYTPDSRPFHTVTAKNHDGHLVSPYLVEYYGESADQPLDEPLPTVTTKDRHALCIPELFPWGLDIRYRMLQPPELKAAQGFPEDYTIKGNKTKTTEQIGNAVPVHLATQLCKQLLLPTDQPTISNFDSGGDAVRAAD